MRENLSPERRRSFYERIQEQGQWWIDYYINGKRKREKIGPDRRLAQTVLKKRKVQIAENRYLDKRKEVDITFKELTEFYLDYSAKHKKSHERDQYSVKALLSYFGNTQAGKITPSTVEDYKAHRLLDRKPATVNRELACMKHAYSKAIQEGLLEINPVKLIKMCKENNTRNRVLSTEEYERLLDVSPPHLKTIIVTAYHTAMRKGEILNLRWNQIDFNNMLIWLDAEGTKTSESRPIPLNMALTKMLRSLIRNIGSDLVFCKPDGSPYRNIQDAFRKACKKAKIDDFVFHDLRHTAVTNMRRAGIDHLTVMKISGHKTMSVFKRYNTIDEDDLRAAATRMDTYMDTKEKSALIQSS